jgi:hypothetical protein
MSQTLTGRLVFNQAGAPQALHHVAYVAILHHPVMPDRHLGTGRTDGHGLFSIALNPEDREGDVHLTLQDARRTYRDGHPVDTSFNCGSTRFGFQAQVQDVGDVAVGFWPYRTDFPTPRAAAVNGELPQDYSNGFRHALELAVARSLPPQAVLRGMHALHPQKPLAAEIQERQPATLTLRVEKETPGRSRSDAWLADQLLNGFNIALVAGRHADHPSRLRACINWGDMPAKGNADLTDVDVVMEEQNGVLAATSITLRIRCPGKQGAWASDQTRTFTPNDGVRWDQAKRVVRCQYLLQGALDGHIATGHFQTEMYAVAVYRNLRLNPVRQLLEPHLQEIVKQGSQGDNFAWGPKGILSEQSALTLPAMHGRIERVSSALDWRTFQPRAVLHASHRYAKASQLCWQMLTEYVEAYFKENRANIEQQWLEIHRFSADLVAHSVPYTPPLVDGRIKFMEESPENSLPARAVVDGVVRAVRPVTASDAPAAGELELLKRLCCYVLFQSTFNHTWTHDGQYDAGGELGYATFGLRNGSLGAEDDPDILPPPLLNIESLSTNTIGLRANYGYILADEENDVPPALKKALSARRQAFADLGLNVDTIRSRINI